MANEADIADERIQNVIDGGIAIAREKAAKVRALVPCNACYWCDGYLNNGVVFCDAGCQQDFYHDIQRRKDLGLK